MRAELTNDDRLFISLTESSQEDTWLISTFFLAIALFLLAFVLLLRAWLALLILSPVIVVSLLLAAAPLASADALSLDRRTRIITRSYRWMAQSKVSQWTFDDFKSVVLIEGVERTIRAGQIAEYSLSLEYAVAMGVNSRLDLGDAISLEEAKSVANRISRYTGWPLRFESRT